jgi:hypothetical protein
MLAAKKNIEVKTCFPIIDINWITIFSFLNELNCMYLGIVFLYMLHSGLLGSKQCITFFWVKLKIRNSKRRKMGL